MKFTRVHIEYQETTFGELQKDDWFLPAGNSTVPRRVVGTDNFGSSASKVAVSWEELGSPGRTGEIIAEKSWPCRIGKVVEK